jgi:DNA polymerase/3'-5' exonuclease PolX
MNLQKAKEIAEDLKSEMSKWSEKIQIAGSIRRGKSEVKDIEIVAIPSFYIFDKDPEYLFAMSDEPPKENLLKNWGERQTDIQWIKPGTHEIIPWQIKPDGKYWRGWLPEHKIKLDLFLANADNWGVIFTIRTGSAEFSAMMMRFINQNTDFQIQKGHLTIRATGEIIPCPTEKSFFENTGIEFVPVEKRSAENPYSLFKLKN